MRSSGRTSHPGISSPGRCQRLALPLMAPPRLPLTRSAQHSLSPERPCPAALLACWLGFLQSIVANTLSAWSCSLMPSSGSVAALGSIAVVAWARPDDLGDRNRSPQFFSGQQSRTCPYHQSPWACWGRPRKSPPESCVATPWLGANCASVSQSVHAYQTTHLCPL